MGFSFLAAAQNYRYCDVEIHYYDSQHKTFTIVADKATSLILSTPPRLQQWQGQPVQSFNKFTKNIYKHSKI